MIIGEPGQLPTAFEEALREDPEVGSEFRQGLPETGLEGVCRDS